uniref:LIM zinc-binding domain-containing protein n=1 Tax=Romanomermis culicivorax TaxID=13658 RepID=A0A915LE99_ROMCU
MNPTTVVCEHCKTIIRSVAVTTGGTMDNVLGIFKPEMQGVVPAAWHPKCFRCSNCRVSLIGQQYQIKGRCSPFCQRCSDLMYIRRCAGCAKALKTSGKILHAMDAFWHARCFRCRFCKKSIYNAWYKDSLTASMPICRACRIDPVPKFNRNKSPHSRAKGKRKQDTSDLGLDLEFSDSIKVKKIDKRRNTKNKTPVAPKKINERHIRNPTNPPNKEKSPKTKDPTLWKNEPPFIKNSSDVKDQPCNLDSNAKSAKNDKNSPLPVSANNIINDTMVLDASSRTNVDQNVKNAPKNKSDR